MGVDGLPCLVGFVHLFRKKMPSLMNCWGTSRISLSWSDIVEAGKEGGG